MSLVYRDIAMIIHNARLFQIRRLSVLDDQIARNVDELFKVLESRKVNYLLVGGIALLNYVEGRNTEDIDLIMAPADLSQIESLKIESQDRDFVRATFGTLHIDFLLTQNPLFDYVRQHCATEVPFRRRTVRIATVEGLILLKFYALPSLYRQGQFERVVLYETDLTMLIPKCPQTIESIFDILRQHLLPGDLESLGEIYADIQARIRRFKGDTA